MHIQLKFNKDMEDLIYHHYKIAAVRLEQEGTAGDTFNIRDKTFKIMDVREFSLDCIAHYLYKLLGFVSEEEFIEYWNNQPEHRNYWLYCEAEGRYPVHFFCECET